MYEIREQKTTINTCEMKGNTEYRSTVHNREYYPNLCSRCPLQHERYSRAKGQPQSSELGTEKGGLQKQAREPKPFSSHLPLRAVHPSPPHSVLSSPHGPYGPRPRAGWARTALPQQARSRWAERYSCGV